MLTRSIYCCECKTNVDSRLTNGAELYPNRRDLERVPYWVCDTCGNNVGCHHKTANAFRPLGCIATPELKFARRKVHDAIDPLWRSGRISRSKLYRTIAKQLGAPKYHTGDIRTMRTAERVLEIAEYLERKL